MTQTLEQPQDVINSKADSFAARIEAERLRRQLLAQQSVEAQPSQIQPSQIQPSQIQPSQIQPSQIQPSQIQPDELQAKADSFAAKLTAERQRRHASLERIGDLDSILSTKGAVSRRASQKLGINGASQEERTANAKAELKRLKESLPTPEPSSKTGDSPFMPPETDFLQQRADAILKARDEANPDLQSPEEIVKSARADMDAKADAYQKQMIVHDTDLVKQRLHEFESAIGDANTLSGAELDNYIGLITEYLPPGDKKDGLTIPEIVKNLHKGRYKKELENLHTEGSFMANAIQKHKDVTEFENKKIKRSYNAKEEKYNDVKDDDIYLSNENGASAFKQKNSAGDWITLSDENLKQINPLANWGKIKHEYEQELMQESYNRAIKNDDLRNPMHGDNKDAKGVERFGRAVNRKTPFTGHLAKWMESRGTQAALKRIEAGQGTRYDLEVAGELQAFGEKEAGKEWYLKAGDMLSEMPAFMVEFSVARGRGRLGASPSSLLEKTSKLALTTAKSPGLIADKVLEEMTPKAMADGKGGVTYGGSSEDMTRNFVRGYLSAAVEVGSEMSGRYLGKWLGIDKVKGMAASKLSKTAFGKFLEKTGQKGIGKFIGDAAKSGGFDGWVEEWLEERLGNIGRGLIEYAPEYVRLGEGFGPIGDVVSGDPERIKRGIEQFGIEAVTFMVPGLVQISAGGGSAAYDGWRNKLKEAKKEATSELEDLKKTGTPEEVKAAESQIESLTKAEEGMATVEQAIQEKPSKKPKPVIAPGPTFKEDMATAKEIAVQVGGVIRDVAGAMIPGVRPARTPAEGQVSGKKKADVPPPTTGQVPTTNEGRTDENEVRQPGQEADANANAQTKGQGQGQQANEQSQGLQGQQEEVADLEAKTKEEFARRRAAQASTKPELPIVKYRKQAEEIESSLPPVAEGHTRIWRGNRQGEQGRRFTNDLPGIALPFKESYKGELSYVDVPTDQLDSFMDRSGAAPGAEFTLPEEIASKQIGVSQKDPTKTASIPVMITNAMKVELKQRGHSDEQIGKMKPADAHSILQDKAPPAAPVAPDPVPDPVAETPKADVVPVPKVKSKGEPVVKPPVAEPYTGFQYSQDSTADRIKTKKRNQSGIKESRAAELVAQDIAEENEIIKHYPPGTQLYLGSYELVQTVLPDGGLKDGSGRTYSGTAAGMIRDEFQKKNPRVEIIKDGVPVKSETKDTFVGKNKAGDSIYESETGPRYRVRDPKKSADQWERADTAKYFSGDFDVASKIAVSDRIAAQAAKAQAEIDADPVASAAKEQAKGGPVLANKPSDEATNTNDLRKMLDDVNRRIAEQGRVVDDRLNSRKRELESLLAETPPPITKSDQASTKQSQWESEVQQRIASVPAFAGSTVATDESTKSVKVTRPDGRTTRVHFNANESHADEWNRQAAKRGKKPTAINGMYVFKRGKSGALEEGSIYLAKDAGIRTLNHEVIHWLEDEGVITPEEIAKYGGREGIATKYGEWVASKQRKPNTVFQKIYDFMASILSPKERDFQGIGNRGTAKTEEVSRPDMTITGQSKPIAGMESEEATYVVHRRKPDMIPDTFSVVVAGKPTGRGWTTVKGTGMTAKDAYDNAVRLFTEKRKPPTTDGSPTDSQSDWDAAALASLDAMLETEAPKKPIKKTGRLEKTKAGQYVLPGMPGMAAEIDRQDFVHKYRNLALEEMREWSDDDSDAQSIQDSIDTLAPSIGNLINEIYSNPELKTIEDVHESPVYRNLEAEATKVDDEPIPEAAILDRVETAIEKALAARPAVQPKPKKRTGRKSDQTKAEAKTDIQAAHDAAAALMSKIRGKVLSGVDPTMMADTVKVAYLYTKAGVKTFKGYVESIIENFGDSFAREFAPYMEAGWRALNTRNIVTDPAGKVADYLSEKTDEIKTGSTRDGVGTTGTRTEDMESVEAESDEVDARGQSSTKGEGSSGELAGDGGRTEVTGNEPSTGGERSDEDVRRAAGPGGNYRIGDDERVGSGAGRGFSAKARFAENIKAIQLLKQLEEEGRKATSEEQSVLVKYVGWGGLKQAFGRGKIVDGKTVYQPIKGYESEFTQLRELLTDEEWKAAKKSITNAHYTDPAVISGMWKGLQALGFKGGKIIEPSSGTGLFFGLIPQPILDNPSTRLAATEIDSLSGRIAQQLYQDADIRVQGFEELNLADNSVDLFISNVPFGKNQLSDKNDRSIKSASIHNFFFNKAIQKTRPGGLVAFITSRFSMDEKDATNRNYWDSKGADLVGVVRLPGGAFKSIANTSVVTDIIILQKREDGAESTHAAPWKKRKNVPQTGYLELVKRNDGRPGKVKLRNEGDTAFPVNEYFEAHPDHIVGELAWTGVMQKSSENQVNVEAPETGTISGRVNDIISELPVDNESLKRTSALEDSDNENTGNVDTIKSGDWKDDHVRVEGDRIYRNDFGTRVEVPVPYGRHKKDKNGKIIEIVPSKKGAERMVAIVNVFDAAEHLIAIQPTDATDEQIETARNTLNAAYDSAVKKFGPLSSGWNATFARHASISVTSRVFSLENYNPNTDTAQKAAIFSERTERPHTFPTTAENANDALTISLSQLGRLDPSHAANLLGKPIDSTMEELGDLVFKNHDGEWELASTYLSGNVRKKLSEAKALAEDNDDYLRNVQSLESVQPKDLSPSEIEVRLGSPWIPTDVYRKFIDHLLRRDVKVSHSSVGGKWFLTPETRSRNDQLETLDWGTTATPALEIITKSLNRGDMVVRVPDGHGGRVVDRDATTQVASKLTKIKSEFERWLWTDNERVDLLTGLYNREINNMHQEPNNGSHLSFPGMAEDVRSKLDPHQVNAVWRYLTGGNMLLAHVVGAGKSWVMAAAAMEQKRISGNPNYKTMITVPNHLVTSGQFVKEMLEAYPSAKILAATPDSLSGIGRRSLLKKVATGNYDIVVIAHSSFGKIPLNPTYESDFIQKQIDDLEAEVRTARADSDRSYEAELQTMIDNLRDKLSEISKALKRDELSTNFDELKIDSLFVDEAHEFKNLAFRTRMSRIPGVNPDGSKKAFDMWMKTTYFNQATNESNLMFATGTPIANAIAEMYTMQRYLQPSELARLGLEHFDSWAASFADEVTKPEIDPAGGGMRMHSRLAQYINMPELSAIFRQVADVQTADMLVDVLNRPLIEGGAPKAIKAERNAILEEIIEGLQERARRVRSGSVDKSDDNMLNIVTDGRKAATDIRLIDPSYPDLKGSKTNLAVEDIYRTWKETADKKLTQIVWLDVTSPNTDYPFNLYHDIVDKLASLGIPREEIAIMHDYNERTKDQLFRSMNNGDVRILLGSTAVMGTGVNVQKKLIASHHIDVPWRPDQLEQRDGRILRRGNENTAGVKILRYISKGSFDSFMWDKIEQKSSFIRAAMSGASNRVLDASEAEDMSAAEMKAAAADDPNLMRFVAVQAEVNRLESEHRGFIDQQSQIRRGIATSRSNIERYTDRIEKFEAIIREQESLDIPDKEVRGKVGKVKFTDPKEFGEALTSALVNAGKSDVSFEYNGFRGVTRETKVWHDSSFVSSGWFGSFDTHIDLNLGDSPIGNRTRLENAITKLKEQPEYYRGQIEQNRLKIPALEKRISAEWENSSKLSELRQEQSTLAGLVQASGSDEHKQEIADRIEEQTGRKVVISGETGRYLWDDVEVSTDSANAVENEADAVVQANIVDNAEGQLTAERNRDRDERLRRLRDEAEVYEWDRTVSPRPKKKKTAKRSDRKAAEAEAKKEVLNEKLDTFLKIDPTQLNMGVDPKKLAEAVDLAFAALDYGITKFDQYVSMVIEKIGEARARDLSSYIEASAREAGFDGVTSVGESLDNPPRDKPKRQPANSSDDLVTSVKNEVVNELRSRRGVPALEDVAAQTQQEWLDIAESQLLADRSMGERLVVEIGNNPRNLSNIEVAVMQVYYRQLNNEFESVSESLFDANDSGDFDAAAKAQVNSDILLKKLVDLEEATKAAGREWGRAGVARQIALAKDFSLVGMMRRARVANTGNPLSAEQQAEIVAMAKQIAELEGKLSTLEQEKSDRERNRRVEEGIKRDKKATKKTGRKSMLRQKAADAVAAFKREWAKLGKIDPTQLNMGVDPSKWDQIVRAAARVVKAYVELGVVSFGEFIASVRKDMGDDVVEESRAAFSDAWEEAKAAGNIPMPDLDSSDLAAITRFARQIQRTLVESGVTDRDEVVSAVHEALEELMPGITRRETMDALSGYGQFTPLTSDEISRTIRDINGQLQQIGKLEDMQAGQAPSKTGMERRSPSDEERRLIQMVNEAKRRGGFNITDPSAQLKTALDTAKTATRNRISDLTEEIRTKEKIVRTRTELTADSELTNLRQRRDELMAIHKTLFPKPGATQAQKVAAANRALDKAIEDLEQKLKTGDVAPKKRLSPISTPALDAKRAHLDALREQRDAIRAIANPKMTPEERTTKAYKASLLKQLADYQERISNKDFEPRPKKEPRTLSSQELALKKQLSDVKSNFFMKANEYRLNNLSPSEKLWDYTKELAHFSRAALTSFDLSAVFRQGGVVAFGHPKLAAKAGKEMLKALVSQQAEFNSLEEIRNRSNGQLYETARLSITEDEGKITRQEEAYMGRWAKQVPGVAASARAYSTFLNNIRVDLFDFMVGNLGRSGRVTLDEAKVIARYINVATGRADVGKFNQAAANLNTVFFAPRYVASRFQYLAMPFYLPFTKTSGRVKRMIAMEYARHSIGIMSFLGLAVALGGLAGDDDDDDYISVELDPRSSDFLKLKIGETRIDPMSGLSQTVVLLTRVISGRNKTVSGKIQSIRGPDVNFGGRTTASTIGQFLRSKLAPVPGSIVNIAAGENVVGEPVSLASAGIDLFIPLSFREISDTMQARGIPKGTAIAALGLLGMSLGTYGQKTQYMTGTEGDRNDQFEKDLKSMQWDSPDPAYSEMLTADQMEQVKQRREERKQRLVYDATSDPIEEDALKRRDEALATFKEAGWAANEAKQMLNEYWKNVLKSSPMEIKNGFPVYKQSVRDRRRRIDKFFEN